jgi:hypothetical protein
MTKREDSPWIPVPPNTDMGDVPLPSPATIILTADDCQDDSDDLPFGPPPPDEDDDSGSDESYDFEGESDFSNPNSEEASKDDTGICEGVPFVRRSMCQPLEHEDKRIYGFEYYEPNLLTHPLAKGFAIYAQGRFSAAGFSGLALGNFRIFVRPDGLVCAEHDDTRDMQWIFCSQEDEWLLLRIVDGLKQDRYILFLDGDYADLDMARKLGLL